MGMFDHLYYKGHLYQTKDLGSYMDSYLLDDTDGALYKFVPLKPGHLPNHADDDGWYFEAHTGEIRFYDGPMEYTVWLINGYVTEMEVQKYP